MTPSSPPSADSLSFDEVEGAIRNTFIGDPEKEELIAELHRQRDNAKDPDDFVLTPEFERRLHLLFADQEEEARRRREDISAEREQLASLSADRDLTGAEQQETDVIIAEVRSEGGKRAQEILAGIDAADARGEQRQREREGKEMERLHKALEEPSRN